MPEAIEPLEPIDELELAKQLLVVLWCNHDRGGISMGRSHDSVVLEAAMALLGEPETPTAIPHGQLVSDARDYLSSKRALKYQSVSDDSDTHEPFT